MLIWTLAAVLAAALQVPQSPTLVAPAGPPILIDTGPTGTDVLMTEERYQRFAKETGFKNPNWVPITKKPAGLSARAMFAKQIFLRGKLLCSVIDGDETSGYVLITDWNANGDLTDETPIRFQNEDGKPSIRVQREERDGATVYPVSMKLMLDWVLVPTRSEKELALKLFNRTTRMGELTPPGQAPLRFRLIGNAGYYAQDFLPVAFDLNRDGAFNEETEVFRVREKYVNIGDTSYEFAVDTHGDRLTLAPTPEFRPRADLTVGSPAPDFSFTDISGQSRKLSDYRGKVVLLDFWGAWCLPCVAEAPKLVAAYQKYRERGFEIVGIDTDDTREKMLAFIETHKMRWTQTMETYPGPIHRLYRISSFPSYLLIGADGIIKVSATGSSLDLERLLAGLFP